MSRLFGIALLALVACQSANEKQVDAKTARTATTLASALAGDTWAFAQVDLQAVLGPHNIEWPAEPATSEQVQVCARGGERFAACRANADLMIDGELFRDGPALRGDFLGVFVADDRKSGASSVRMSRVDGDSVSGTLTIRLQITDQTGDTEATIEARGQDIVLDPNGCPVNGKLVLESDVVDESQAWHLTLGPHCGDVTVSE